MSERQKNDFYPTPQKIIDALLEEEEFEGYIWEPACGDGAIVKALKEFGYENIFWSDIKDYGFEETELLDFINDKKSPQYPMRVENIVTNPPYNLAKEFMSRACSMSMNKTALLFPLRYLAGKWRANFYRDYPLSKIIVIPEKVDFLSLGNPVIEVGWFIWDKNHRGRTHVVWPKEYQIDMFSV